MIRKTIRGVRIASITLCGYWLVLFTLTHWPNIHLPPIPNSDKAIHFVAYSGLAFLMAWSIPNSERYSMLNVFVAGLIAISYGAVDEFSQIPVGRTADVADWFADCAGVVFGLVTYVVLKRLIQGFGRTNSEVTKFEEPMPDHQPRLLAVRRV